MDGHTNWNVHFPKTREVFTFTICKANGVSWVTNKEGGGRAMPMRCLTMISKLFRMIFVLKVNIRIFVNACWSVADFDGDYVARNSILIERTSDSSLFSLYFAERHSVNTSLSVKSCSKTFLRIQAATHRLYRRRFSRFAYHFSIHIIDFIIDFHALFQVLF